MSNSEQTPKPALSATPMMYWLCVVCGAILLVSFIPYSREHGLETWTVFVSLFAPAFPGLLYVLAKDAGESGSSILLLVVFTVYMLAVIGIVIDLVKRAFHKVEPMPVNGILQGQDSGRLPHWDF